MASKSNAKSNPESNPESNPKSGQGSNDTDGRRPLRREKPQQVADELRRRIVAGGLDEGESLGHEAELIEHFGVSRPSLREALRILEAEGLITVVRGVLGGVIVHRPDRRQAARTAALVLQAHNVSLADVFDALIVIEPAAVRMVAGARGRRSSARRLGALIDDELESVHDPDAFRVANTQFHEELVSLAGNQTLTIVAGMLNEVLARAVAIVSRTGEPQSVATRRRSIRSQQRLAGLVEAGEVEAAEGHWRTHMTVVGRVMLGHQAETVVDVIDHF